MTGNRTSSSPQQPDSPRAITSSSAHVNLVGRRTRALDWLRFARSRSTARPNVVALLVKMAATAQCLILAGLLGLLAFPSVSVAQEPPSSHHKLNFLGPVLIHGGSQALDYFSTRGALGRGAQEVGPIASHTGPNTARLLGGAAFLGADLLAQKHGPGWLKWVVRAASVGVGGYAYAHNSRAAR